MLIARASVRGGKSREIDFAPFRAKSVAGETGRPARGQASSKLQNREGDAGRPEFPRSE